MRAAMLFARPEIVMSKIQYVTVAAHGLIIKGKHKQICWSNQLELAIRNVAEKQNNTRYVLDIEAFRCIRI